MSPFAFKSHSIISDLWSGVYFNRVSDLCDSLAAHSLMPPLHCAIIP